MNRTREAQTLKGKVHHYAKLNNIEPAVIMQNFMFERFLARLAKSEYQDKFILKGGILVSTIVGLDSRSTMDLDVTLRNLQLEEEVVLRAIKQISQINLNDDVVFSDFKFSPIRPDDEYGGFRVKFNATYFSILTPLSIDISTGDKITPSPFEYEFSLLFDTEKSFKLWGYNIETILAEKVQTIISRGVASTRPRDFYDVYILTKDKTYNRKIFKNAFAETCAHRGTENLIQNPAFNLSEIEQSKTLQDLWQKYTRQFSYAKAITYEEMMESLRNLIDNLQAL